MNKPDRTAVLHRILAAPDLPSPSASALRIVKLTQDENVAYRSLEQAISSDPAFVARLLKVANAGRSATRPVVAVKDALLLLGLPSIRGMAVAFSIFDQHQAGQCKNFDYRAFWTRSLMMGVCLQHVASAAKAAPADEAFTIGLLANIGSLALASIFPEPYSRLLHDADQKKANSVEVLEQRVLGVDHWEVSSELMKHWGLPQVYSLPVELHRRGDKHGLVTGTREYQLTAALALCQVITDLILLEEVRNSDSIAELYRWGARVSLEADRLIELGHSIAADFERLAQSLGLSYSSWMNFAWAEEATNHPYVLSQAVSKGDGKDYNILLVEDDRAARAYLTELLTEAGYQVTAASCGEEALNLAMASPPSMLLTDWVMPGMDGLELIKRLRSQPWGTGLYMLVITAKVDEEYLVQAFEAGTNDYIPKPIKPRVLIARLRAGERMIQFQREAERQYLEMKELAKELSESNSKLRELSVTDALTGCPNRRYALERLQQEWAATDRRDGSLSCLVVDVDWFKTINDLYGHERGDEVLCLIANTLREEVRGEDVVCRVGGDEFWIICPDADQKAATICAERLCQAVFKLGIQAGEHQCTVSVGVAEKSADISGPQVMIELADRNLYLSKRGGRGRVSGSGREVS